MNKYIIAFDLGTGGNKASLYDTNGYCLVENFAPYKTYYPQKGFQEQKPEDWWQAIVTSTRKLLQQTDIPASQISCCGISGHSLGVILLNKNHELLKKAVPIWSDSRPGGQQMKAFFKDVTENKWYNITGNGFPPALYSLFKILWYRDHEPEVYENIDKVIGTKDYINFRLTGKIATDFSYASGCGLYDLAKWQYNDELVKASGINPDILPEILPSTQVLGQLTNEAANELGLSEDVQVVAGGVDNSCMALGAMAFKEGRSYNSLGSSSWIAIASQKPLLNERSRPYVFAHVVPGMFVSATAIFSAGSSFKWVRDQLCSELIEQAKKKNIDDFELLAQVAQEAEPGSNGILFNPSLAGGSFLDESPDIRGGFIGLELGHSKADIIRATMEGISLGLTLALDELKKLTKLNDEIIVVGGGSKNSFWRQIYADMYDMKIIKTSVDQQAAALGAAALAAVGTGLWKDFNQIDEVHKIDSSIAPDPATKEIYKSIKSVYRTAGKYLSDLGIELTKIKNKHKS